MKNPFKESNVINISTKVIEPDSWGCLSEGYFWAVKVLLENIINSTGYQNRWVLYPIMFNIRHYYELALKDILVNMEYIDNENILPNTHDLRKLLNTVEKYTVQYFHNNKERIGKRKIVEDIQVSMNNINCEMKYFEKYDNGSFSFRYPYTKKGCATIKEKLHINIPELYKSVLRCRKELHTIVTQLICDDNNKMFIE